MVILDNIEFSYLKGIPVLSGITAKLRAGIYLLAGENGAGKTTLLNILAGLDRPSGGTCTVGGFDPARDVPSGKGNVFMVKEHMDFPHKTIRGFARLHSRFYPRFSQEAFESNLEAFGLTGNEVMKDLSFGNRKKSQLAYALALGTDTLLLDEPTNGLDIESKETLKGLIALNLDMDRTLIVATHTISELENLYDGAIMISGGRLLMAASEEEVLDSLSFGPSRGYNPEALYSEQRLDRILSITPARKDEEPTKVDWRLLYSALHSPEAYKIMNHMTEETAQRSV